LLMGSKTKLWIQELYQAGVTAKQGGAAEQALEFFERCAELLSGSEPEGKSDFEMYARLGLSECRFVCGQTKEAEKGFETLLEKYPETENQIRIKRKYINLCACNGDFEKVIELGIQILAHLKFNLNTNYLILDLLKSRLLFSIGKISRLEAAPAITDQRLLCILDTMTIMAPAAERRSDKMAAMIALKLAVLSARHGNSDYAPIAYAAYSYTVFHILKDHKKGKSLLAATLALIDGCENASLKSAAYCILGSLAHHCVNPLESTVGCLAKSIEEGEKGGASLYGSYAIAFTITANYMMGVPLRSLGQYIDDCRKKQNRLEYFLTSHFCDIYEDHICQLEKGMAAKRRDNPDEDRKYCRVVHRRSRKCPNCSERKI